MGKESNLAIYYTCIGGLGNRLFGYISTLGIAMHNNRSVVFGPSAHLIKEVFPRIEPNIRNSNPEWKALGEANLHILDTKMFNLPMVNMTIGTYLKCFRYFKDVFGQLYKDMLSQLDDHLLRHRNDFVSGVIGQYRFKNNVTKDVTPVTICVHVRRGDFLAKNNIKHGYLVPSKEDILFAMNYTEKKVKKSLFIVVSNDLKWCKDNLSGENVYFSNFESANQDFVVMSHCDHMIMTVGTFGWWAAWFTAWRGGTVLYYRHQFNKGSYLFRTCNRHDFLPSDWLAYNKVSITKSGVLSEACN